MKEGGVIFNFPEWFMLLPLLLIITLILRHKAKHKKTIVGPSNLALVSGVSASRLLHPLIHLLPKSYSASQYPISQNIVYALIISCFVTALAEPVRIGERLPDPPQERDIVFIIDTSVSMILRDYVLEGQRVDRMSLVKELLDRFIQKLEGERLSLIVLGSDVYTLVPLTRDQKLLRRMLSRIESGMAGRFNNIGEGIALAVKQANKQTNRHRALILLSDASQPTGTIAPMTAAQLAKESNLPLYTIAIGATSYAAEEIRNAGLIYHPADLALLKSIAEHTGAQSYQASDSEALEQAIHDIEQRETNYQEIPARYFHNALYTWPLFLGLLLFIFVQFLHILRYRK